MSTSGIYFNINTNTYYYYFNFSQSAITNKLTLMEQLMRPPLWWTLRTRSNSWLRASSS